VLGVFGEPLAVGFLGRADALVEADDFIGERELAGVDLGDPLVERVDVGPQPTPRAQPP
jgi:hypothetical protein